GGRPLASGIGETARRAGSRPRRVARRQGQGWRSRMILSAARCGCHTASEDTRMKRMPTVVAIIFACALAWPAAQGLPSGVQKLTSLGGITEYQYPNGLRVLLYP